MVGSLLLRLEWPGIIGRGGGNRGNQRSYREVADTRGLKVLDGVYTSKLADFCF